MRVVIHFWYLAWPDHNVPEDPNSLIQLIKHVEKCRSNNTNNINAINNLSSLSFSEKETNATTSSSSYSGSTSTLTNLNTSTSSSTSSTSSTSSSSSLGSGAVLVHCSAGIGRTGCFLALAIGIKQLDSENMVDIVQIVCRLRKDRGGMRQTLEQYEFIYQVLAYYCVYHRKFPLNSTSTSSSPSIASPMCLQSSSSPSSSFSFNVNAQTIQ